MRKKNIQRLVIAAVLLIVLPFVISQFMLECLTKLFAMDPDQASTIASTGQVIVQALAAVMIIVQLGQDNREAKQQSEIEAARLYEKSDSFIPNRLSILSFTPNPLDTTHETSLEVASKAKYSQAKRLAMFCQPSYLYWIRKLPAVPVEVSRKTL